MGYQLLDQYSLLHMATGIVAFFFHIKLLTFLLLHTIFELFENMPIGIYLINRYLKPIWPGGKIKADAFQNIIGDTLAALFGWCLAYWLNSLGKKYNWYFSKV